MIPLPGVTWRKVPDVSLKSATAVSRDVVAGSASIVARLSGVDRLVVAQHQAIYALTDDTVECVY